MMNNTSSEQTEDHPEDGELVLSMIARIKAWLRFDAEALAATAHALAAFSGAPQQLVDIRESEAVQTGRVTAK